MHAQFLCDTEDSVYQDWLVQGESHQNEGLCQRFLITYGKGRQVGQLKHKRFATEVYKPLVKELFTQILKWIGPKQGGILHPGQQCGIFDFSDSDERLAKNVRMVCTDAGDSLDTNSRRKMVTGLGKCGYWLPLVSWENFLFDHCFMRVLGGKATDHKTMKRSTRITTEALAAAVKFVWLRHATGQAVLDNDIARIGSASKLSRDRRDKNLTPLNHKIRRMLMQCPAHILTLDCIAWFCSPTWDSLKSKNESVFGPALDAVLELFEKMEEYSFGRVLRSGRRDVAFQKKHAEALPPFAKELLSNELRVPLWIFGSHLPGPAAHIGPSDAAGEDRTPAHAFTEEKTEVGAPSVPAVHVGTAAFGSKLTGVLPADSVEAEPFTVEADGANEQQCGPAGDDGRHGKRIAPQSLQRDANPATQLACGQKAPKRTRSTWDSTHLFYDGANASVCDGAEAREYCQQLLLDRNIRTTWVLKASEKTYYRLEGQCVEAKCCSVKYWGRIYHSEPFAVEIRQTGEHSHAGQELGYGNIFSAKQAKVAERYLRSTVAGTYRVGALMNAFRTAGIDTAELPESTRMWNWIIRQSRQANGNASAPRSMSQRAPVVASLQAGLAPFKMLSWQAVLEEDDMAKLCVLPTMAVHSAEALGTQHGTGYIPFLCRGMLESLRRWQSNMPIALSVDAKVSKGQHAWRTATIGLLHKSELRRTSLTRGAEGQGRVQMMAYPSSFVPLLQARVHQETKENYRMLMRDFAEISSSVLGGTCAELDTQFV